MEVAVRLAPGAGAPPPAHTAVVVDVLRATTTLTHALANGATRVVPAATVEDARAARDRTPGALLCGEREGRRIEGFDLGNSPDEYPPATVTGRTLVFASTNGSRAMLEARTARRVLLGAFVNLSAVVDAVRGDAGVTVVCAGKLGRFCLEDAACAGMLCARLAEAGATLTGPAATLAARIAPRDAGGVRALVRGSDHGRYLRSLGEAFARDVERCGTLDAMDRAFAV